MIRLTLLAIARHGRFWLTTIVLIFGFAIPTVAGVALPPMPDKSNTNAMAQYWIKVNYDARKSQQEKLRVGRERYQRMLAQRAAMIEAIGAELAERQKTVVIEPQTPVENTEQSRVQTQNYTLVGIIITGLAFLGFRHFLSRQEAKDETVNYPRPK